MSLGKTWVLVLGLHVHQWGHSALPHLSHLGVPGVCLAVEHGAVAVAQNESLELLLWLFTLDRRNPALFSWRGSCVRGQQGKCPVDKCGSPRSRCFCVLLFSPAWRWWIECQLFPVQLPDITTAASLGLTLCSSDWAEKGMFWFRGWHLPELPGSSNRSSSSGAEQQFWDKGFLGMARGMYW